MTGPAKILGIINVDMTRAKNVYIRQTMSVHVTAITYVSVIGYKPTYVTNNIQ